MMTPRARRQQSRPAVQSAYVNAPIGGVNAVSPPTAMPDGDCIFAYNLLAGEGGLLTRPGWRPYSAELNGMSVPRTLIGYKGGLEDGSKDRIWAITAAGIANATDGTHEYIAPTFPSALNRAGLGVYAARTGVDGARYVYYADEQNGLYLYKESTDAWTKVTQGVGADQISVLNPANIAFVMVFKQRTWFVERGTAKAWYLDAGSITGPATAFDFGGQFRTGGGLVGLWSWTYDGGAGLDDALVGISTSGDVVIYQGTDPDEAGAFGLKGVWSVGAVPRGRRIATNFGGDVLVLSFKGLIPLSQLVLGNVTDAQYITQKIQPLFNRYAQQYRDEDGWSVHLHPAENALMILVPEKGLDGIKTPLVMSFATKGWFPWRDLSVYCCDAWRGDLYLGCEYGQIGVNTGFRDFADDSPDPEDPLFAFKNRPVAYGLLTGFSNLGRSTMKQGQMVIPTVISETAAPNLEVRIVHGVNTSEIVGSFIESVLTASVGAWGVSLWGQAVWGGSSAVAQPTIGGFGIAREVGLQVRGFATSRTNLVGWDVLYVEGGLL